MLSAVTSAKSYSFSEFFFSSVVFFTVSAVTTLMMQGCTADRSLFSDTHCALHLSSVSVAATMMCSMSSQFMLFMWDCCVMINVVVWHSWVTAFWIESRLWLTHCSKVMYSSYNTEIDVAIRACMSITSRLLLRNVFLTALSYFKSSAFSNVCSKVVRCLVNGFSFCFNAFKIQVALSLNSELLYTC